MSWKLFKVNMLTYMNNPKGVISFNQYAAKLTLEYDMCMRRGGELIGKNPVAVGNVTLMTQLMIVAHLNALGATQPGKHAFLKDVGNAVKGYWTGATLQPFPVTPIPASGAVQNLLVNQALVTSPGKWPNVPFEIPTTSSLSFINMMVLFMQIHLLSLKGMYLTTSLYPSVPSPIPAPGIVNWQAYSIPNIPFPSLKLRDRNLNDNFQGLSFGSSLTGNSIPINAGQQGEGAEKIDNELVQALNSTTNTDEKLDAILNAELAKDKLGNERFFTQAELNIPTLAEQIKLNKDSEPIRKSIAQIRQELVNERRKCCDDCD